MIDKNKIDRIRNLLKICGEELFDPKWNFSDLTSYENERRIILTAEWDILRKVLNILED
jgi:hypothetical protein